MVSLEEQLRKEEERNDRKTVYGRKREVCCIKVIGEKIRESVSVQRAGSKNERV